MRLGALLGLCLAWSACGRSGDLSLSSSGEPLDLGEPADLALGRDMSGGECGFCPPPLMCHNGMCCAGMICIPPPRDMGRRDMGRDMGRRDMGRDMGRRDMSLPPDAGAGDMSTPPPPADLGPPPPTGCTNDTQCPGMRCDWLTGMCVPIESCNRDSDCPPGDACVNHQCLAIDVCLPFPIPGVKPCPPGERCQFPPGVCIPDFNCGPGMSCPSGEHCVGGYCQPNMCGSSADCNDGYNCVKGQCVPRIYCGPFERCPRGMRCVTHVCQ